MLLSGGDVMQTERAKAKTFRDLTVWRKAHEFVLAVYRFTSAFPKSEIQNRGRLPIPEVVWRTGREKRWK